MTNNHIERFNKEIKKVLDHSDHLSDCVRLLMKFTFDLRDKYNNLNVLDQVRALKTSENETISQYNLSGKLLVQEYLNFAQKFECS